MFREWPKTLAESLKGNLTTILPDYSDEQY